MPLQQTSNSPGVFITLPRDVYGVHPGPEMSSGFASLDVFRGQEKNTLGCRHMIIKAAVIRLASFKREYL